MYSISSIPYFGESLSLIVAAMWTTSALFSEVATKRLGANVVNMWRMIMSMSMIAVLLFVFTGNPLPPPASFSTWIWLLLSGIVGYVFGDYCLFNAYHLIGSRFAQLFMTISPAAAGLAGWIFMGQTLSWMSILGMTVTSLGIALSILGKSAQTAVHNAKKHRVELRLPLRGVLYGLGAGLGQGLGLVLSSKGLQQYDLNLKALSLSAAQIDTYKMLLPFAATFVRGIAGLVGFSIVLMMAGKVQQFKTSWRDTRGLGILSCAVVFGPFVGVSLSLMATRYTSVGVGMTLMSLSPILILAPAHWLFGHRITLQEIVGACISLLGVTLFFIG